MPHSHGGFHGGGGGRGRFFGFGGGGGYDGGYPYPYYPIVPIVPMVITTEDDGSDDDSGTSIGYARGSRFFKRPGGLVDAAKVIIPAPTSVQLTTALEGMNLTITACVDGKCYRGVADLSGILAEIEPRLIERARQLHQQFHEQSDTAYPRRHSPLIGRGGGGGGSRGGQGRITPDMRDFADAQDDAIGDVQERVNACGEALVGAMLAQHHAEICAGWWHSLTHGVSDAVKKVGRGVSSAAGSVGNAAQATLKTLGPVIAVAAGAAATAMVGPEAGPLAASLTNSLVNAASGSGSIADVAQSTIAAATQAAQSDPQIAQALAAAHQAVAQTTAAAHVAQTLKAAASGSPAAKQQVLELTTAAAQGDPAAQGVVNAAQDLTASVSDASAAAANIANMNGDNGDDATVSGASLASGASQLAAGIPGRVVGVVQHDDGNWSAQAFASSDAADDWFGQWLGMPHAFRYVAYFDKGDSTWPGPLNEQIGHAAAHAVSGWFLPAFLAGGAGFAAGRWGGDLISRARDAWRSHTAK